MSECIYKFKDHEFSSKKEYENFLLQKGDELYEIYGDLVFNALDNVITQEALKKVKAEAQKHVKAYAEAKKLYQDGEDNLEFKRPYIGVTEFLADLTNSKDQLLMPSFREFEYWRRRIKDWKDPTKGFNNDEIELFGKNVTVTDNVSEDQLKEYLDNFDNNSETTSQTLGLIKQMKDKWKAQGELGTEIHSILEMLFRTTKAGLLITQSDKAIKSYINLQYKDKKLKQDTINSIIKYGKKLHEDLINTYGQNLTFFPEFKVVTKLGYEIEGKGDTILGKIDLLVVDGDGYAHVIDYKTSPKDSFDSAKQRAFWYQMGLYHRMIENAGIRVNSPSPKVIVAPIKMHNFRQEGDTWVFDTISARLGESTLEDITTRATLNEVAANIDEFIPPTPVIDLTPKEIVTNVSQVMEYSFPSINMSKTWGDEEIKSMMEGNIEQDPESKKWVFKTENSKIPYTANTQEELFEKVKKFYQETLPKKRRDMVASVEMALKKGIKENTSLVPLPKQGSINVKQGASAEWFQNLMGKYCRNYYEIIENEAIKAYGVILLRNKLNGQIDILKITTDNLDYSHKFNKSSRRQLLTGAFEVDSVQARKPGSLAMKATNGNIHLMETMAILNCLPEITSKEGIIGNILVANPHSLQGTAASNEELVYNFGELVSHIDGFQNNIKNIKFANKVELAKNKLREVLELGASTHWEEDKYKFVGKYKDLYTQLDEAVSTNDRRDILRKLEAIRKKLEEPNGGLRTEQITSLDTYSEEGNEQRTLYNHIMLAIAEIQGVQFRQQTKDNEKYLESMNIFNNGVKSLMLDNPGNLDNATLNKLTSLITEAYQNTREDMMRETPIIRELVEELKKSKGFGKLSEMTVGNQASLYRNMIEYKDGDILFKNPWSNKFSGTEQEKKFLKYALTKINQDRFGTDELDEMITTEDVRFFRVPLAVGSLSSQASQLGSIAEAFKKRLVSRLSPKRWWEETQKQFLGVFSDVQNPSSEGELFQMNNMFDAGKNTEQRLEKIAEKGYDYFENNLETLLLKHIFAYSTKKNVDLIMPMAKASMIHVITQGQLTNKKFTNTANYITDYIKSHIKNESLIPENQQNFNAIVSRIKNAASFLVLGFSPIQYGYQMIQALWTDIRLMYQGRGDENTPFTFENFAFAFKEVYRELFTLGGKPTKCSLLNDMFAINDRDMNTYAEQTKSDRYGIFNMSNIAFHCTSRPDYYSRMSIFVTQLKQDGSYDAYEKVGNKLVYDWKKDKRFEAYANGRTDDPKYNEQKGLYYAIAEQLEIEHAKNADGSLFQIGQPLPKSHTNQQIESFKSLADDIYGYYAHEKKAMVHSYTLGALWMQMRTFWSGKKNQYLGGQGIKLKGRYAQQKDANGNLLYLTEENGRMIPTTENTGVPVVKWEGEWQEGIMLTLSQLISGTFQGDGLKHTFEDMWYNEDEKLRNLYRANLRQIQYDLLMLFIVGSLVTGTLADWDDENMKKAKDSRDIDDAAIAAAAHMACKMVSSSFLDLNFIESIGGPLVSWQPMSFSYFSRRAEDIYNTAFGDTSFTDALIRMSSLTNNTKIFWNTLLPEREQE